MYVNEQGSTQTTITPNALPNCEAVPLLFLVCVQHTNQAIGEVRTAGFPQNSALGSWFAPEYRPCNVCLTLSTHPRVLSTVRCWSSSYAAPSTVAFWVTVSCFSSGTKPHAIHARTTTSYTHSCCSDHPATDLSNEQGNSDRQ